MFIPLRTPKHYLIEGLEDYRCFLRAIPLLVQPDDVLAISCWGRDEDAGSNRPEGMRQDISALFEHHQLQPDELILAQRRTLELYKDDYPHAYAVLWPADLQLIRQLHDMLSGSTHSSDLCTHIMGYGSRGALFCFHDAFTGGELRISTRVPEKQVTDFCRLTNLIFQISDIQV